MTLRQKQRFGLGLACLCVAVPVLLFMQVRSGPNGPSCEQALLLTVLVLVYPFALGFGATWLANKLVTRFIPR